MNILLVNWIEVENYDIYAEGDEFVQEIHLSLYNKLDSFHLQICHTVTTFANKKL